MKKFLLSLAVAMTAAFSATAQTVITADQLDPAGAKTVSGYTVDLQKNDGSNNPIFHANTGAIRLYAKGSLTVSGEKITKIVVTLASDAGYRYTSFTPSVGELNPAQAVGDTEITWVGDAPSVTFTVGDFATMGSDGETKPGQIRFASITVYGEGGTTPDVPDPVDPVDPGEDGQVVIKADQLDPAGAKTVSGYTVDLQKNDGSNNPIFHANTGAIRLYAKGSLTVSGEQITKIVVALASDAGYRYTSFTPSVGELNPAQAVGDTEITWVGDAPSVTFTVGDFATMGSDGETKPGQIRFTSITVYGKGGQGGTVTPPTPAETVGDGTEANPYTVADVIALNNVDKTTGPEAWITGFIVGTFNGKTLNDFTNATGAGASVSNLAIAATADETDNTKMVPVALPTGAVRTALNLQDRPALLGREVSLKGNLMAYFGTAGLKNTSDYSVVGGLPEVPVNETESLTSFIEEQDTENFYKIKGAVTVFYQSPDKKYTFITDGTSNLEVYGALANAYANGDVLTGIIGKFGYYQNMPQMAPQADSFGEATKGEAVAPVAKALADVQVSEYVVLSNVNIVEVPAAEEGKASTWNVVDGAETRQLFDRFAIGDIKAAEGVKIVGIGSVFGETNQIFPVEIDYDNSAISEISAAANGQTVVYDLQGRRLAAPVKGINIINGKKVLVK